MEQLFFMRELSDNVQSEPWSRSRFLNAAWTNSQKNFLARQIESRQDCPNINIWVFISAW